jgi:hypothetical protein
MYLGRMAGGEEVIGIIGGKSCSLDFCALLHRPPLASSMKRGDLFAAERPLIGVC